MRRLRRTKVVATLGPASGNKAMIARLFEAGADVFRINMSHSSHDRMRELVEAIRSIEQDIVGRQTRVVTSYGYRYDGPYDAKIEELYDGLVGVADSNPGRAWATARARDAITPPSTRVRYPDHARPPR